MIEDGQTRYSRWWEATKNELPRTVCGLVGVLKKRTQMKRRMDVFHARLYSNYDVAGTGHSAASSLQLVRGDDGRMRYQLCTSIVDTMHAMLTSNKPVPYYLSDGGGWGEQRKAKRKSKLVVGQFLDLDIHKKAGQAAFEALVYGTGLLHGYVDDDGKVQVEKVPQHEITVDVHEASSGSVRSIHRRRMVPMETLAAAYPKMAGQIRQSEGPTIQDWEDRYMRVDGTIDMVMVTESWRMPSIKGGKDGVRVITTSHAVLHKEEWPHEWLPFAEMRWKDRLAGWWGSGIIEETKAAQLRCNKLIKRSEKQQDIGTNLWVFVDKSSGIEDHQMTNTPMQIIPYNPGTQPPIIHKQDGTPHDLTASLKDVRDDAFQQVGISAAMISGEKQPGLNSAVALRTAEDIGSRRHTSNIRQWEFFFTSITRMLERLNDLAADKAKAKGKVYYVRSIEKRGSTELSTKVAWTDVQTSDNSTIRMFPVSALGNTPAGKMESVRELVRGGYVPMHYAMKLLDLPDIDAVMAKQTIDLDTAQFQLDRIQDGAKNILPLPFQNMNMAFEEARTTRLQCEVYEAPKGVKDAVQKYMDFAMKSLVQAENAAISKQQEQQAAVAQAQAQETAAQGAQMQAQAPVAA